MDRLSQSSKNPLTEDSPVGVANPLVQALMDLWQGPQTLAGLARSVIKTGKLPNQAMDPQGNREFRFDIEGENPLAMGSVITGPKDLSGSNLAHERVHTRQSRELGPAYIPARVLGDAMSYHDVGDAYEAHPMEDEAYLETSGSEELLNRLMMQRSLRRMNGK